MAIAAAAAAVAVVPTVSRYRGQVLGCRGDWRVLLASVVALAPWGVLGGWPGLSWRLRGRVVMIRARDCRWYGVRGSGEVPWKGCVRLCEGKEGDGWRIGSGWLFSNRTAGFTPVCCLPGLPLAQACHNEPMCGNTTTRLRCWHELYYYMYRILQILYTNS